MKKISIMTPCYNEELGILDCYSTVKSFFENNLPNYNYEHIFIDNASEDKTVDILREIALDDKKVKVIVNSRNFGSNHSPYYAILQCTGDCVIPVVADLQTPVQKITEFVNLWEDGYDMVLGLRTGMSESIWMKFYRNSYYKIMNRLSDFDHYFGFIGFGLFDRKTVDAMRMLKVPNPYFRTIISEIGYKKAFVHYHQPPRKFGKSRLSFYELIDYAFVGLISSSKKPLRLMTLFGLFVSTFCIIVGFIYLALKIIYWDSFSMGVAPLLISLIFSTSVLILCIGLIGEYLSVIFDYARDRPLVVEKERINFD